MGFIFGGNTGISGPEELERRRALARAVAARQTKQAPTNFWDGLNFVTESIGQRVEQNRLDKAESEGRAGADSKYQAFVDTTYPDPNSTTSSEPASYSPGAQFDTKRSVFLNTIAGPESGGKYDVVYGGGKFTSFADHPRTAMPIMSGPNKGRMSSAAGKYQMLGTTWDQQKAKLKLPDFNPESQDAAAWDLAVNAYHRKTGRNLGADLQNADDDTIKGIVRTLSGTWTSLPGGIEQTRDEQGFVDAYRKDLDAIRPQMQTAGKGRVGQAGGLDPRLMEALIDPWLEEGQRDVLKFHLQRQLAANDPMRLQQLEKSEFESDALKDPKPEYGFTTIPDGTTARPHKAKGTVTPRQHIRIDRNGRRV